MPPNTTRCGQKAGANAPEDRRFHNFCNIPITFFGFYDIGLCGIGPDAECVLEPGLTRLISLATAINSGYGEMPASLKIV